MQALAVQLREKYGASFTPVETLRDPEAFVALGRLALSAARERVVTAKGHPPPDAHDAHDAHVVNYVYADLEAMVEMSLEEACAYVYGLFSATLTENPVHLHGEKTFAEPFNMFVQRRFVRGWRVDTPAP